MIVTHLVHHIGTMGERILLSALCIAALTSLRAQSYTLTANEQLPIGSTYTLREVQNLAAIDTTLGQNVTWQFNDLIATATTSVVDFLAPGATPYGASFPTADHCVHESGIPRYSYFSNTADSMSRIGYYAGSLAIYSDPQVELVYPVQYGDSNSDTWANSALTFPGTYDYDVVGTGTLILPSGTWNDVLLLRLRLENVFPIVQYVWMSATNGANLLLYMQSSFFGPASALMLTSLEVGISDHAQELELRLHAPSNGMLPLTYANAGSLGYRVLDPAGRLITTGRLAASAQPRTELIDITALGAGLHLIEVAGDGQRRTMRFFVD
ncbi:MAG: hypothetical protein KDB95_14650 [Flavobacteriales bacterium]|nr:hypothetical protein [Flavobacteriales bacterium]